MNEEDDLKTKQIRKEQYRRRAGKSALELLLPAAILGFAVGCHDTSAQQQEPTQYTAPNNAATEQIYSRPDTTSIDTLVIPLTPNDNDLSPELYKNLDAQLRTANRNYVQAIEQDDENALRDAAIGYKTLLERTQQLMGESKDDELAQYSFSATIGYGKCLIEDGSYEEAKAVYEPLKKMLEDPEVNHPRGVIYFDLARIATAQGDTQTARDYFFEAGRYYTIEATEGEKPEGTLLTLANESYQRMLTLNPNDLEAYGGLVNNLIEYAGTDGYVPYEESLRQALEYCNIVLDQINPVNPETTQFFERRQSYCTKKLHDYE